MKKVLYIILVLWCGVVSAQNVHVEIKFPKNTDLSNTKFYIADEAANGTEAEMAIEGTSVKSDVPVAQLHFYSLTTVCNGGQVITPLYINKEKVSYSAELKDDLFPIIRNDRDNRILSTYSYNSAMKMRRLWMEKLTQEQIREMYSDYTKDIREADAKGEASAPVAEYLKVWGYSTTYQNISNLPQILRIKPNEVTVHPADVLPAPKSVLDNEISSHFSFNAHIICDELSSLPTLDEKLTALQENYRTQSVRDKAQDLLLSNYITGFDYEHHNAEGLTELSEATTKYSLSPKYLEDFKQRAASITGAAFPTEFTFTDKDGNKMDFSQFRGKYVYVDLWASWCVPCCKQVPFYQELEKNLQNTEVAFLSISIDGSPAPWLKRMEELNMHGNQWLCTDSRFCESLNITGIPHYLIYNREGRLINYDAPVPSSGEKIKSILETLK